MGEEGREGGGGKRARGRVREAERKQITFVAILPGCS